MKRLTLSMLVLAMALPAGAETVVPGQLFSRSTRCTACHDGIVAADGEDASFGASWRGSMMANAARDPYWQASVRRETIDHPAAAAPIENECAACHMPMTRFAAKASGAKGKVFEHLPVAAAVTPAALLAADGVSCSVCHQIRSDDLGTEESFTAGFSIDPRPAPDRAAFGPYEVAAGHRRVMRSAVAFEPTEADHIRSSELCATCHTLFTHALDAQGNEAGTLPEQVPYLEWRHSAWQGTMSCQECHMPALAEGTAISSVLPVERDDARLHGFRGGNFLMPRILALHASELGTAASAGELTATSERTIEHLRSSAASLSFERTVIDDGRIEIALAIENLAGHKLPTAYPSRRAWVHLVVRDPAGTIVFESGAREPSGAIRGNDNDLDASRFEPHYSVITREDEVQIYEPVLADSDGNVTTGLIRAVRYVKDNRILPAGFDKTTASEEIAVSGAAAADDDFTAGGDTIRYSIDVEGKPGPFSVAASLWYQPIGFRWAENLAAYDSVESARFGRYFRELSDDSAVVLAEASARVAGEESRAVAGASP